MERRKRVERGSEGEYKRERAFNRVIDIEIRRVYMQ